MKEPEMKEIARLIDETLSNISSAEKIASVRADVQKLTQRFPLYPELQSLFKESVAPNKVFSGFNAK